MNQDMEISEMETANGEEGIPPSLDPPEGLEDACPSGSLVPARIEAGERITITARKIPRGASMPVVPSKSPAKAKGGKYSRESEMHKAAFAFYFSLGESRSLGEVADHFGKKLTVINQWSSVFQWKKRLHDLENRTREDLFRDKALELLLLTLESFEGLFQKDKKGKPAPVDRVVVDRLKMTIEAFKKLKEETRESATENEDESGRDNDKKKPGVMVNVIITKSGQEPQVIGGPNG